MKARRDIVVRTVIWLAIATALAIAAFAASKPPDDKLTFFDWKVPESALGEAFILLVPALLLATGEWDLLGLKRPRRLRAALGIGVLAIAGTTLLEGVMNLFGDPGKEQGITPDHWIHGHNLAFGVSLFSIAVVVPFIEETFFRGVGLGLLLRIYAPAGSIMLCGCLFGLVHGLVLGFLPLAFLGSMLALMRVTTGSTIPGIVLHGAYNTLAVLSTIWLHW